MKGLVKVLLVEDNLDDVRFIRVALTRIVGVRYEVEDVQTLEGAIETLRRFEPEVILLDLRLPNSSGLNTYARVRDMSPDTPIVVFSGSDDDELALNAVRRGAQDYLVKGQIDDRVLSRALRYAIERHKLDTSQRNFIASAAHELRAPLAVVVGTGSTLAEDWKRLPPEKVDELFEALGRQSERVRALADDLLDLSRIQRRQLALSLRPVEVGLAVQEALVYAAPPQGVSVEVDVAAGATVVSDSMRLEQILVNLLTNAYLYGGPNIGIHAGFLEQDVVIAVQDDGPGLPEEIADSAFEPFVRAEAYSFIQGSGLGLSIAQGLARVLGGELWYEPNLPRGSRFLLRLPAAHSVRAGL